MIRKMPRIKTVGIMADSHDNMAALEKAVDIFNRRQVDLVLHAGDLVAPFTARALKKLNCPLIITLGNNDGEIVGLLHVFKDQIFQPPHHLMINEKKVLLMHDPLLLNMLKKSFEFDVIIYGHLHQAEVISGKPLLINPGECGGWLYGKRTVAIWETETDDVEILEI